MLTKPSTSLFLLLHNTSVCLRHVIQILNNVACSCTLALIQFIQANFNISNTFYIHTQIHVMDAYKKTFKSQLTRKLTSVIPFIYTRRFTAWMLTNRHLKVSLQVNYHQYIPFIYTRRFTSWMLTKRHLKVSLQVN